ncbi:MAG: hypothetical protein U0165_18280 [Polyangiaceae bacterium]
MNRHRGLGLVPRLVVAAIFTMFCAAPTPGDIGGCGQPADDLDPAIFFRALKYTDCSACQSCGFSTRSCDEACDANRASPTAFPENCAPLAHDGEVCLRKLQNTSCDDYSAYVRDDGPTRPSECQFCPVSP